MVCKLLDEGHLLATRNGQAFRKKYGRSHLEALRKIAKVVVLVYDPYQTLVAEQYVDPQKFLELQHETNLSGNLIELTNQMRISASNETLNWLETFIHKHVIMPIPYDNKYDLRIFNNPNDLYDEIQIKLANTELGLSRMLATYNWNWKRSSEKYCVVVDDFIIPWNYYFTKSNSSIPWAENPESINEIGSTFTIQGFDLNYAGVIIGIVTAGLFLILPSLKIKKRFNCQMGRKQYFKI